MTDIKRTLGVVGGTRPGPLLVVVGGLHGNEPSGVEAALDVLSELRDRQVPLRGEFAALAGNTGALREGIRYKDADLNRLWSAERMRALDQIGREATPGAEDREQRELLEAMQPLLARESSQYPRVFLDLHSTSSDGPPFLIGGLDPSNVRMARATHLPLIVGLQQVLGGALTEFMLDAFDVSMAVEGGVHDSELTRDHHRAILWTALVELNMIEREHCAEWDHWQALLLAAGENKPPLTKVVYHHRLEPAGNFKMDPGYQTFHRVRAGARLAQDADGDVLAPSDGILIMPLYQTQGDDGFFLGWELEIPPGL